MEEEYELRTMDKARLKLTKAQADAVLNAITQGQKFIILRGAYILVSNISGIFPVELVEEQTTGRLHDGTQVMRMYGRWVDAENPDIKLSYSHYPELASGEILTERQYQEKRTLMLKDPGLKAHLEITEGSHEGSETDLLPKEQRQIPGAF